MNNNLTNGEMKQAINQMLQKENALEDFASSIGMPVDVVREFFKAILSSPEMSDDAKKFVWNGDDKVLKAFLAGQEKGESTGFWKGVLAGVVGCLFVAGAYFKLKKEE